MTASCRRSMGCPSRWSGASAGRSSASRAAASPSPAVDHAPAPTRRLHVHGQALFDGATSLAARARAAEDPRQGHRDDLPGPDDFAEPGVPDRRASWARRPRPQPRPQQGADPRAAPRDAAGRSASPSPESAARELSARDVGRHAPAGDDRHGADQQPRAADRRRAHHRPRRHHSGPDPRAHRAACAPTSTRPSSSSPTTSAWWPSSATRWW